MSIKVMSAVWDCQDLQDSEMLVFLALADWSDEAGKCWPSVAQIAAKTRKSERTIQGVIKSLVAKKHMERVETPGKGCTYRLHPRSSCAPADTAPAQRTAETPAAAAPNTPVNTKPQKATPSSAARNVADPGAYHRLPEDWMPTRPLPLSTQAKVAQWPPGKFEDELAGLRRWAANASNDKGKGRKLDWDMAFVNWLEKADNDWRPRNGRQLQQPANDGLGPTVRAALHAKHILDERARHV